MARRRPLALALPALFAALAPLAAAAQAPKKLAKPEAEFPEPFTNLTGVRELRDGRVVTADVRDKVVQVVDFKTGSATKVGREGSGPGEYALPMALVALQGDSSAIFDPLNSRLLVVLPNGKAGDFIRMEEQTIGGPDGGRMRMGMTPPRYTDARGRLYSMGNAVRFEPGQSPVAADSAPILRYDRASKKSDTVAYLRLPKNNTQVSGGSGNMRMQIGAANPFAPRDEWAVLPDGRVLVLRSPEYRVDVYGPSGRAAGAPIAYEKLKVTERHKALWRESRRNQTAIMMTIQNGERRATAGPPPANTPDPADWPELLPPFLGSSVFVAPNGTVWVARTRAANDETPDYDVIDGTGKVVARYELPKGTRLVAVGNGVAYAVRTDEDDLQYLQRYRVQ